MSYRVKKKKRGIVWVGILLMFIQPVSVKSSQKTLLLTEPDDREFIVETFLAPGEFSKRRVEHVSYGDEAVYSLDSSLGAMKPFAELHPERLTWPDVAGLQLRVGPASLKLKPSSKRVTDDILDRGFRIRWVMVPLGQRFDPSPYFACRIVEAEVLSEASGERLLFWSEPAAPPVCVNPKGKGHPHCSVDDIGHEVQAVSLSPNGHLMAMAFGGLRPRLEMYDVRSTPYLVWQTLFSKGSGGAVETAFSEDGKWVVALTGRGRMHRFDAITGGRHMAIPSRGRTARSIPPGELMAVAGESGEVTLWYLTDGTIGWRLPPRSIRGPVDRVTASGDGQRFATLEYAKEQTIIRAWTLSRRAMLSEIEIPGDAIVDIALDESGSTLYLSHESKGLLKAKVSRRTSPIAVGGKHAERCRGRIQWMIDGDYLSCGTRLGVLRIDRQGGLQQELKTAGVTADWLFTSSSSGTRLAAVGGGRLLIWWTK